VDDKCDVQVHLDPFRSKIVGVASTCCRAEGTGERRWGAVAASLACDRV
jgi:hypothetical protein